MTASIWPGSIARAAGRGDVRVDVADRDRDALGQPGPLGRLRGQAAGARAERRAAGRSSLSATKSAKRASSARR